MDEQHCDSERLPDLDEIDGEAREIGELCDTLMYTFHQLKNAVRRKDKHLFERWKAGGCAVDGDFVSMYPAIEEVVSRICGE